MENTQRETPLISLIFLGCYETGAVRIEDRYMAQVSVHNLGYKMTIMYCIYFLTLLPDPNSVAATIHTATAD